MRVDRDNIDDLEKQFQELNRKLQEVTRAWSITPGPFNSTMTTQPSVKFRYPIYNGESKERPMQFLRDLQKFIEIPEIDD